MNPEYRKVANSYLDTYAAIKVAKRTIGEADFQLMGNGLVPEAYDEIVMSYSGSNISSVVYKLDTVVVATLTLSYSGDNLTSVVRS